MDDDSLSQKKRMCASRDRLSELPDSLIFDIFWLLPMRDVVGTTFLSKRWKNLWKEAPCLNFEDAETAEKFINWVLMAWRGTKVEKLKIDFGIDAGMRSYLYSDLWVRFAKEFGALELHVDLGYAEDVFGNYGRDSLEEVAEVLYTAIQCLYSCSSLEKLHLKAYELYEPWTSVNWDRLKCLRIDAYRVRSYSVQEAVSGSPNLEALIISFNENLEDLHIKSTSLKHLSVDKFLAYDHEAPHEKSELRISTPNLEILELLGVPYHKCRIEEEVLPYLVEAKLLFYGPEGYRHHSFSNNDSVKRTLKQILPSIQHVRRLTLSNWTFEVRFLFCRLIFNISCTQLMIFELICSGCRHS